MKKINIAFLIYNMSNKGGTERVTSVIANALVKKEYNVSIISCYGGQNSNFFLDGNINLYSACSKKEKGIISRKIKCFKAIKNIVITKKIDVLIAVDVSLYLYIYPLQKKKICKCIAWEHFNYYIKKNFLVSFSRKLAAAKADLVVVLGKKDLENYKTHYKKINHIEYIYNPIALSLDKVSKLDNKRVIAVGRLEEQKGFLDLIKIWSLVEKNNEEWKLDIYGDGMLKEQIQDEIEKLKLKNVELKGYSNDIEKEYLNSSLFVLTSKYEGFVLVLMEALSKGLPCISYDCKEGPSEIIDNNKNGYLIEPGNIEKFAEKLEYLMKNEKIIKDFGKKCQKDLGRFDLQSIIDKWDSLIKGVIK